MKAGKALTLRELAALAVYCALLLGGKEAMRALPNIHPVTLLLIVCTLTHGARALYPAVGFVLLELAVNGAGLWSVMYAYAWPLVVLCALPFRRSRSRTFWACFAGVQGLTFGAVCALPYLFVAGPAAALAWWVAGIPFDLTHAVSNAALTYFLLPPLLRVEERIKCS